MTVFRRSHEQQVKRELELSQRMAAKADDEQRRLIELKTKAGPQIAKVRAFFQKQCEGATNFGFQAAVDDIEDSSPLRYGVALSMSKVAGVRSNRLYLSLRVTVQDDGRVRVSVHHDSRGRNRGEFDPALREDLGPIDHPDIIPRVEAHLEKVVNVLDKQSR
ncbi:hypothetical protein ACOTFH_21845 [Achromobacter xylosoxidans]|uniref:hypothetical protein n=1 Tax=Achromobacter ruhlandii TaxID=72557 RepID=UPI001581F0FD|nr:hypothetical protein [Achromobacter ruhlandii]